MTNQALNTKEKGKTGEDIACVFLEKNGFNVLKRNYSKKWGELDIVAEKDKVIHFFEVKSVTWDFAGYKPEDNVHGLKVRHLRRIIGTYLEESGRGPETVFHFHVLTVSMNMRTHLARVRWIQDLIL